jgi:hypothetical protein
MSSLRNAVQRRQHRERAQPANREKWGLLEKHKVSLSSHFAPPLQVSWSIHRQVNADEQKK